LKTISQRMIDEKISAFLVSRNDVVMGIVTHEDLLRVLKMQTDLVMILAPISLQIAFQMLLG